MLLDGSAVAKEYGVFSIPTVFWINREGVMIDVDLGFNGDSNKLEVKAKKLLGSRA